MIRLILLSISLVTLALGQPSGPPLNPFYKDFFYGSLGLHAGAIAYDGYTSANLPAGWYESNRLLRDSRGNFSPTRGGAVMAVFYLGETTAQLLILRWARKNGDTWGPRFLYITFGSLNVLQAAEHIKYGKENAGRKAFVP